MSKYEGIPLIGRIVKATIARRNAVVYGRIIDSKIDRNSGRIKHTIALVEEYSGMDGLLSGETGELVDIIDDDIISIQD